MESERDSSSQDVNKVHLQALRPRQQGARKRQARAARAAVGRTPRTSPAARSRGRRRGQRPRPPPQARPPHDRPSPPLTGEDQRGGSAQVAEERRHLQDIGGKGLRGRWATQGGAREEGSLRTDRALATLLLGASQAPPQLRRPDLRSRSPWLRALRLGGRSRGRQELGGP